MADKQPSQQSRPQQGQAQPSGFHYLSAVELDRLTDEEFAAYQREGHDAARHDARLALRNGEGVFDVEKFPLLRMREIESECQTLTEYGIDTKLLKGSGAESQRAREVIFVDGDPAKGYKHKVACVWPAIKNAAYADPNTLAQAVIQWLQAVREFNAARVWIGVASFGRKDYHVGGTNMDSEKPNDASVLLKDALEKGCDLALQGKMNSRVVRPAAEADAEAKGFRATGAAKPKATKLDREI